MVTMEMMFFAGNGRDFIAGGLGSDLIYGGFGRNTYASMRDNFVDHIYFRSQWSENWLYDCRYNEDGENRHLV